MSDAEARISRAPRQIAGWTLLGNDYAEPVAIGGGFVEVQDDGVIECAAELAQRVVDDTGLDKYQIVRVPIEVMRQLIADFDAAQAAKRGAA